MEWTLLETEADLAPLIDLINQVDTIALDLEADSLHHYHSKICLIQITVKNQHFLIDTLSIKDMSSLLSAIQDKLILAHGCDYDLRMMNQHWNFIPSKIFDTMVASRLIGAKAFGLASLAKEFLGMELDKGSQKADWSLRPLPDVMQKYAALDTAILHELVDLIQDKLIELGRLDWAVQSCEHLRISATLPSDKKKDDPWRVKGSTFLASKELAILKVTWAFREEIAMDWDQPVFKILSNEKLVQIACSAATLESVTFNELPKMPRNFKGSLIAKFLKIINDEISGPRDNDPSRLKRKPPPPVSPHPLTLEYVKEQRDLICSKLELEPTLLANKLQLVNISTGSIDSESDIREGTNLMEWQYDLLIPKIVGWQPK